jgi:hypothetical protein
MSDNAGQDDPQVSDDQISTDHQRHLASGEQPIQQQLGRTDRERAWQLLDNALRQPASYYWRLVGLIVLVTLIFLIGRLLLR